MATEVGCMVTSIIPKFRPLSPSYGKPSNTTMRICCSQSNSNFVQQHHQRRSAQYQPTIWSYDFVQSLNTNDHVVRYEDEVKKLEKEVKCVLVIKNDEDGHALLLNKLELVDEIQRLGLGYRFKEDIKEVIDGIFNIWDDQGFDNTTAKISLYTAALGFRLLRHHGYQVSQELPLHQRMQRLEARWYIESYSKRSDPNQHLLQLAKLDFNMVQSIQQKELKDMSRWDVKAVEVLPEYMKLCFLALYNTVNQMVYETLKEQGQNSLPYLTKAWADMCKAFLVEAKWCHSKCTPTFEEYMENGWMSISGVLLLVHAYFLVSENISTHGVDCLENHHNLLHWPSIIFRLSNDLGTSAAEIQRGETANSISCSMRQNDQSEDCARKYLHNLMEESWKKMNMEIADGDSPFTKPFLDTAINLARISRCTYQYGDGHGAPDKRSKNRVLSLMIDPIQ
ncbi:hypothetical protein FEM48_Zijuj04G0082000 [Ziziphus jujuba var. spinosa]|uniref:Uncharacterized protein n=1 Tax=Ziziphus jujuba var. spinosa TaxID=714518 RepID=A0A978VIS1_ZIZJJ|nr:hypothetical protein FEM48_Zijuj04G0082000 [Ziziphus jujuba var. spinosa]